MKEYNDIGTDEMLEWAKMNGMNMSEGKAKELVNGENTDIDLDEWFKQNNVAPIGEYENLSKKMKTKIQEIISSLKEEKEKQMAEETDERDERDTLDEKEGKEELDENKKKEVDERKHEDGEKEETDEEEKSEELENKKEEKEVENKEETPKKAEYLAKVKKLHEMKIRDYKDQMKKDDATVDKYFITMMYLQKNINRQRNAFIKEYGSEELTALENEYLKEELKYEKTLNVRMERDLNKLRQLDLKLDSILDKMQSLQKGLEDGSMSLEEYNDEINSLEKDKLDTLWQINRLNPELLEEKQENLKTRGEYEKKTTTASITKERKLDMTPENKVKTSVLEYNEGKQQGKAEEFHEDINEVMKNDIDEKEKRLDELRNKLKGVDITTPNGKKEALEIIGEIQALESQKMSQEKQLDNLEKNMGADVQNYSDLEESEIERRDSSEEFGELVEDINPSEVSDDLMSQLRNQALEEPSTPEQAEEYLDNINEISEEAEKNQDDKEKESDETEEPTLWNRRKRAY